MHVAKKINRMQKYNVLLGIQLFFKKNRIKLVIKIIVFIFASS